MKSKAPHWEIREKNRLLFAVMEELAGDAQISFEGDLQAHALFSIEGASTKETVVLKRNSLWPGQDFVVVPLERLTVRAIIAAIGGSIPRAVLHIQIAKAGKLEFGAYDNFHPECLSIGSGVAQALLHSLANEGILKRIDN